MSDPNYAWQLHDLPRLAWPMSVQAKRNNPPTVDVSVNDAYIVAANPTGEWIDKVHYIAIWSSDNQWVYQQPERGRRVFNHSTKQNLQFNGREWAIETDIPPGGTTGYVLAKKSDADYDAEWIVGSAIPGIGGGGGGTLVKLFAKFETLVASGEPEGSLALVMGQGFGVYRERGDIYEMISGSWVYRGAFSQYGVPMGGTTGQVLAKTSGSDFAVAWVTPTEGAGGDITSVTAGTGLSGGGTSGDVSLAVSFGTASGTACEGNDSRLSNDRTASGLRTTGGVVTISSASPPEAGQVLVATSDTAAEWQTLDIDDDDGDISAVLAGDGLTGGSTSGAATLAVDFGTGHNQVRHADDSVHTNDRTASGLRTATGIVSISSATAPTAGQTLIATSSTTATWQDLGGGGDITAVVAGAGLTGGATSGSATLAIDFGTGTNQVRHANDSVYTNARTPTGSAGGDLGGSYPNPTVTAVHTGATHLAIGTINDGEFLQRSGTTIVSAAGSSAPQPVQVNGSLIGTRDTIDIVAGTGISLSGSDDSANNRVRVTVNSTITGDITAVSAGNGLTGGGSSGDVSLAVAFGTGENQVRHANDSAYTNSRTPTGSAGGDLGGTYPNPTVTAVHSISTKLNISTINDGEFLQRSGDNIVSAAGTSAPQPVQVDGTLIGTRDAIDIVAGTGISLSGTDDDENNRVRVTITATGGGGGGSGSAEKANPWVPQEGSDLDFNDEFDGGSADLATRGWIVENWSTGATMTRQGDVTWHAGLSIDSDKYRSTIVGSDLWIQTPSAVSVFFYKTFDAGDYCFAAQFGQPDVLNGIELKLWAYHATRDPANKERNAYASGIYTSSNAGVAQFIYTNNSGSQLWNTASNTFGQDALPADVWTIDLRSSGKVAHAGWNSANTRLRWSHAVGASALTTAAVAAGIQVTSTPRTLASSLPYRALCIGWIRRTDSTPL